MIYLQTVLLAGILAALVMILRRPDPPPIDLDSLALKLRDVAGSLPIRVVPAEVGPPAIINAAPDPAVWEVCQRHGHELRHAKFVREGTAAFEHAFQTPGLVLKQGDMVQEGVQDAS